MNKTQLINELKSRGFSEFILKAFEKIKRENFIPENLKLFAYNNEPLSIANGATISQPYTIAFMLNLLELNELTTNNERLLSDINNYKLVTDKTNKQGSYNWYKKFLPSKNQKLINNKIKMLDKREGLKILEIGSGSGYVLALINKILKSLKIKYYEIYGIERIKELAEGSKKIFEKNKKIIIIRKDGSKGLPEKKPFDRILISAAFEKVPEHLFGQLKENGVLVTPVRNSIFQFKKIKGKIKSKEFPGFIFVPVIEDNK